MHFGRQRDEQKASCSRSVGEPNADCLGARLGVLDALRQNTKRKNLSLRHRLGLGGPINQYTGQLYEGQGRNIITAPGTIGMLLPGGCKILLGTLMPDPKAPVKPHLGLDGEWQQIEILVRGNTLVHMINGHVMSVTMDDDLAARASQGILSLQLEGSGQIWYRNVYLKLNDKSLDVPR